MIEKRPCYDTKSTSKPHVQANTFRLPDSGLEDMPAEGIFEELDAAPGQLEIKAFDSHGVRMALLQFRAGTVDDELLADLKRWHARKNLIRLRLV